MVVVVGSRDVIVGFNFRSLGLCKMHVDRLTSGFPMSAMSSAPWTRRATPTALKPCSYGAAHHRCRRLWGKANQYDCANGCGRRAMDWSYDGCDPNEHCEPDGLRRVYSQYPEFYMPVCRFCHAPADARWRRELSEQFAEFRAWKVASGDV
jgi:hypothetical protein